MRNMSFTQWLDAVENCISRSIYDCSPRAWNEDHISYSWISDLTSEFESVLIEDLGSYYEISWDAYKADGALEEDGGDVALLVKITFGPGVETVGAAFMEAKRIYPNRNYAALNWAQLERQVAAIANHRVLLYDNDPIREFAGNLNAQLLNQDLLSTHFRKVRSVVIPTRHLLAISRRGREVHQFTLPLSYQICVRYLRGFDLDYSGELVNRVSEGAVDGIKFLVVAHVSLSDSVVVDSAQVSIDSGVYSKIERSDGLSMAVATS